MRSQQQSRRLRSWSRPWSARHRSTARHGFVQMISPWSEASWTLISRQDLKGMKMMNENQVEHYQILWYARFGFMINLRDAWPSLGKKAESTRWWCHAMLILYWLYGFAVHKSKQQHSPWHHHWADSAFLPKLVNASPPIGRPVS